MGLLDLPTETLGQICSHLCPHCVCPNFLPDLVPHGATSNTSTAAAALCSLSRTCRLLCALAQPLLYHDAAPRSAFRLLRTLVARPHLAALVRGLRNDHGDSTNPDPADVPAVADAAASRLGMGLPLYWMERPWDSFQPYVWEMLLGLTAPRLEALRYVFSRHDHVMLGNTLTGPGISKQRGGAVPFPRLRRLWIGYPNTEGRVYRGIDSLRPVLAAAPRLEALTACNCDGIGFGLPLAGLRELRFSRSFLKASDVTGALAACPGLESFAYEWVGLAIRGTFAGIQPGQAWEALRTCAGTLRSLSLDFGDRPVAHEHLALHPRKKMGSLVEFRVLERLTVSPGVFTDDAGRVDRVGFHNSTELVQMLPPSLRVLSLPGNGDDEYKGPIQLVEAKRQGQFPHLVGIEVSAPESVRERIAAAFAEVGVDFKVCGRSSRSGTDSSSAPSPSPYPFREDMPWPGY